MTVNLRYAQSADAAALAQFCEKTFRETFSKDNSPEDMDLYISKSFSESIQRDEITDPKRTTVMAYTDQQLVGFYQLLIGHAELDIKGFHPIELVRFYVGAEWHGQGVAKTLMENCLHQARQLEFATLWLGVWENNFRAQAFYKKWGFNEVGSHIFKLGNDPQRDLLFSKTL